MTQLFNQPVRGSFADQLARARQFAAGAPGSADAVEAAPVEAFAAADPATVDAATGFVPDGAAMQAGGSADDLARAAQEAASGALADPAFRSAADQVMDIQVQPRLIVQGQSGPIVIPVDIAVPAAQPRVTIAAPTAVVVDPATGQAVANAAAAAPETVASAAPEVVTSQRQSLRSMSAADLGALFGGGHTRTVAAAPPVVEAAAVADAAPAHASALDQLRALGQQARTPRAAAPVVAGDAAAVGGGLLDRIRAGVAGMQGAPRMTDGASEAATVVDDAVAGAAKSGLMGQLRDAARLAKQVNPKG